MSRIEARTRLLHPGQVAVAADVGGGVEGMQGAEQFVEGHLLFGSAVVFPGRHQVQSFRALAPAFPAVCATVPMPASALLASSPFVTYADRACVVAFGMAALH